MMMFWRLYLISLVLVAIAPVACGDMNSRNKNERRGTTDTKSNAQNRIALRATENRALYLSDMLVNGDKYSVVIDTGSSSIHLHEKADKPDEADTPLPAAARLPRYYGNFTGAYGLNAGAKNKTHDPVYLANVTLGGFVAANQTLAFASDENENDSSTSSINLFGMTLGEDFPISGRPETFWQRILRQMDKRVVSAVVKDKDGFFDVGGIPEGQYEGDLTTVPLEKVRARDGTEKYYQWKIATQEYGVVNATDSQLSPPIYFSTRGSRQYKSAIVDSATSSMIIDPAVVKAYYENVKSSDKVSIKPSSKVAVKCNSALPDLLLGVADCHGEARVVRVSGQSLIMPYDEAIISPSYRDVIPKENGCKCFLRSRISMSSLQR